jgi:hypothetical protein
MDQLISVLPELIIGISTAMGTVIGVIKTNSGKMDKLFKDIKAISLDINRLTLHDEHLAIEERLAAGDRFIEDGGNGATKVYYEILLNEYRGKLKL